MSSSPELWDQWANIAFANDFLPDMLPTKGKRPFLKNWTKTQATELDITAWRSSDNNIGIRASYLRAIDIDVPDDIKSSEIMTFIRLRYPMPLRYRAGTGKCLLAFCMLGNFDKLSFKTNGGNVEFLANKQQFVVAGTHPDGTQYEWLDGVPEDFPILTPAEFDQLWYMLQHHFSITSAKLYSLTSLTNHEPNPSAYGNVTDDVADYLRANNLVAREDAGRLHLHQCPWADQHTDKRMELTQTTYFVAKTNGYPDGAFKCLHTHCKDRTKYDFELALGYIASDFEPLLTPDFSNSSSKLYANGHDKPTRFVPVPYESFYNHPPPRWIVKGLLPQAELAVIYGAAGSGKTFMALDIAFAIARGVDWRGHKTKQGRVVYLCAEGAGGFRLRLKAYAMQHRLEGQPIPLSVIAGLPNLLEKEDALDIAKGILTQGPADVIIIDTFAQVTAGGDENTAKDMSKALAHCKGIHAATGALIVLIHHAGKDETKGARGWSGIRAAADAEIEVFRTGAGNGARVTKQKDGDDSESWGFKLHPIVIGKDEEDQDITSCYVEYAGAAPVKPQNMKKRGFWQQTILESFDELGGTTELVSTVINHALRKGSGPAFSNRQAAKRALERLSLDGEIKLSDGGMSRPL